MKSLLSQEDCVITQKSNYPFLSPVVRQLKKICYGARFLLNRLHRRTDWFLYAMAPGRALNAMMATVSFVLKRRKSSKYPLFVKIDISPLCNLHCTVCVHAEPNGNPDLLKQRFHPTQRMKVEQYKKIIDEIRKHSLGVVLFYLGDPITHPQLPEICRITGDAGLTSHISTNLSTTLTDSWIREIITSGLTHLTVCVDGLSQEKYRLTRVGGQVERVKANLERFCTIRKEAGRKYPRIEVQYIKYKHNLDEIEEAQRLFTEMGVDQFHELWGWLHNYTDRDPGHYRVDAPRKWRWLPQCHWPHFFTLIKYNGDVIPCCSFRLGQQYSLEDKPRAIGNVFESSLESIWNGSEYQKLRMFASNPGSILSHASLSDMDFFCDDCPRLFSSDFVEKICRYGNEHAYEEIYTKNKHGRPKRWESALPTTKPKPKPGVHTKR